MTDRHPTPPALPDGAGPQPSRLRGFFAVGGPAFNAGLVAVLGCLSAFVVAAPDRAEGGERALGEEQVDWARVSGEGADHTIGYATSPTGVGSAPAAGGSRAALPSVQAQVASGVARAAQQAQREGAADPTTTTTASAPASTTTPAPASTMTSAAPDRSGRGRGGLAIRLATEVSCDQFDTWIEAQAVYASDPPSYPQLDTDGDGRACEGLPGTPPEPAPPTTNPPGPTAPKVWVCADFPTQPEAQAAFDRDPIGFAQLDGDGDGRACEGLPGTPPEGPVDDFVMPTKADLLQPAIDLFGLHTAEAPFWFGEVDELAAGAGKAPSAVLFFQKFNQPFPTAAVAQSWARHAVPIITWEPTIPNSGVGQPSLDDISGGTWDSYIDAWARAAAASGQPVVIRFAPEMNGSWYSWSEGEWGNDPGDYVQAWRHVHDRFNAAGASNVLWLWSPNRVDQQRTPLAQVYPGDAYVDWVGMSAYYRGNTGTPDFDTTFGRTLSALRAVSTKPIFIAETGADSGDTARDVTWIGNFFAGLAAQPDVIGFAWFNEPKTNNDWRLQRDPALLAAFALGVRMEQYLGG